MTDPVRISDVDLAGDVRVRTEAAHICAVLLAGLGQQGKPVVDPWKRNVRMIEQYLRTGEIK